FHRDTNNEQVNHPLMLPSPSLPHPNATATCQNATCGSTPHAHSVATSSHHAATRNMPPQCRQVLSPGAMHVLVLYFVIATLGMLVWWMGVTHTQVRAWVHQQGLAVKAGLRSASKCLVVCHALQPPPLQHSPASFIPSPSLTFLPFMPSLLFSMHFHIPLPSLRLLPPATHFTTRPAFSSLPLSCCSHVKPRLLRRLTSGIMGVGEAVATAIVDMAETHKWKEAMEMRMNLLGVQLEATSRELAATKGELEEAERRRGAEMREVKEHQDAVMQLRVEEAMGKSEGDEKKAWQVSAGCMHGGCLEESITRLLLCLLLFKLERERWKKSKLALGQSERFEFAWEKSAE
ncbi:unnamed protein product, partial [Closterium sp. Naga37s-1]